VKYSSLKDIIAKEFEIQPFGAGKYPFMCKRCRALCKQPSDCAKHMRNIHRIEVKK